MPNGNGGAGQVVKLFEEGNWSGYEVKRDDGKLDGFKVIVHYVTGWTVSITLKLDGGIIMRIMNEDKNFGAEGSYIAVIIAMSSPPPPTANRAPYNGQFSGTLIRKTQGEFDLGNNLTVFTELKQHHVLEVTGSINTGQLSLAGSRNALNRLASYLPVPGANVAGQAPLPSDFNPSRALEWKDVFEG